MCVFAVFELMNSFCWMYSAFLPFARHVNTSASRGDRSYCSAMARQRSRKGDAFFGGSIEGGHSALAVMRDNRASSVSESSAP